MKQLNQGPLDLQVQLGDTSCSRAVQRVWLGARRGRGCGGQVALLAVDATHGQKRDRGDEHERREESIVLHFGGVCRPEGIDECSEQVAWVVNGDEIGDF